MTTMEDEYLEDLAYVRKEPSIHNLNEVYRKDLSDHSGFADQCADSYNQRRMWWPGKSLDQKKHQLDAKPWPMASDQEVPVIDPRINTLVALIMNAIRDGNITAAPVNGDDVERAASTTVFIRWMLDSWIPGAYDQIELSLNDMFEKGIAATWVGWEKRLRTHLQEIDLEEIAEQAPEMAELLADEDREDEAIEMLQNIFEGVNPKRAKKAFKQLRQNGVAEIPVVKGDIDRPVISAKCPQADIIYPSYTMDTKRVDRVHIRHFMSIQDLKASVHSEGWDEDWVDDIIENHMGMTQQELDGPYGNRSAFLANQSATLFNLGNRDAEDLVEIVRTFQRLVDEEDGAEGYYQTVWAPNQAEGDEENIGFGLFELLNGYDEFPIAVTTMSRDSKRIYDQRNVSDLLRGNQRQAKVSRDAFVDQLSIMMNPPRTHPAGRPASVWGAGADFATRRGEEGLYKTLEVPNTLREGTDYEQFLIDEADFIMGLKEGSPMALQRQQYYTNRGLAHVAEIARLAYKAYQKFYDGEDIHFRVTNSPDPQTFNQGPDDEELDIKFFYDVRTQDREYVKETVETLLKLPQADPTGTVDPAEIVRVAAMLAAPQFASRILRSAEASQADVLAKVSKDLALIYSGQEVAAQPNGGQIALEYIKNTYVQNPDILRKLQEDPIFAENLNTYVKQYEFQAQQNENAQTGRLGTPPTDLQATASA
mgnify:CR=1 FL=1